MVGGSLSADVSNAIYWVTETSRGLSMCEEKQDGLVFLYGLQRDVKGILVTGNGKFQTWLRLIELFYLQR